MGTDTIVNLVVWGITLVLLIRWERRQTKLNDALAATQKRVMEAEAKAEERAVHKVYDRIRSMSEN